MDYVYDWDWPRAEQEFRKAVEHGAEATTRSYYGWSLATRGRFQFNQMMAHMLARRYREAKQVLQHMLDAQTGALNARLMLGVITIYEHDCAASTENFESAAKMF